MFLLFRKACFLYKTSKIVYPRSIFTIFGTGITGLQGVTGGYRGLQWVTGGYKGLGGATGWYRELQGVTGGCKGLKGVKGGDKGLQGVTNNYRNFFLTTTFPDTFS